VPRVDYGKLSGDRLGEPSVKIRERVERARERQRQRFAGTNLQVNADMGPAEVRQDCVIDDSGKNLPRAAMQQMQMSARAYHPILKLARTIAKSRQPCSANQKVILGWRSSFQACFQ
jgi:magnesium chelatase family protein